jgi:ribose/xylose/arabinose/galactoside ABC-type transport system permease subunit
MPRDEVNMIQRIYHLKYSSFILTLLLVLVIGSFIPYFLTVDNLLNVVRQTSIIAICAVGATMVIIIKGIDLSTSGLISLCAMVNGTMLLHGIHPVITIVGGLTVGLMLGLGSGYLVARMGVPAFIATLVIGQVATGFALLMHDGRSIGGFPEGYVFLGNGELLGIPISDLIMLVFIAAGAYLLGKMPFGNHVYALGNNESVVKNEGISVNKIKLSVFAISGLCSAAAGILLSAQLDTAHPTQGEPYLLDAIAACIIGGVSLMGGEGRIIQAILGAMVIGSMRNALNLLGIHPFTQNILIGSLIILIVAISIYNRNRKLEASKVY